MDGERAGPRPWRPTPNLPRMATQGDEGGRARILRVGQVSGSRWTVSVDDDPTPLSEHRTRSEAEAAAREHAQSFGYPEILVYDNDGNQERIVLDDVDPQPGYPGAATGESAS
jgi:Uncharacterized protein conserved in bacteria (DUF2188)